MSSRDALRLAAAIRSEKFEVIRSTGSEPIPAATPPGQVAGGNQTTAPGASQYPGQPATGQGQPTGTTPQPGGTG